MTTLSRKFEFEVSTLPSLTAEEIHTYLSTKYVLHYVGIFRCNDQVLVYTHFKNIVVARMVMKLLDNLNVEYRNVSSCKKFHGTMLSEHGTKLIHGNTKNRSSASPVYIEKKIRSIPTPTPPSPTPPIIQEYVPVNPIVLPKNLPGIPEISDMSRDFHAIWGSQNGHWFPIGYVGPERYIVAGKRKSVPQVQIDELFRIQDSTCAECSCDVFMGKLSNADVDHIIPLRLGGSCQMSNLQILCVTCHRRKTALECKKIRCNVIVGHRINLEPGYLYIACSDIDDPDYEILSKNPKEALSNRDGLFRLVY